MLRPRIVIWHRSDLRVHDSALLAAARAVPNASVLPAFVLELPSVCRLLETPRCGPHRARFLAAALHDLRARLRRGNSGLALLSGAPETALCSLRPDLVLATGGFTPEERSAERRVAHALRAAGGRLELLPGETLFDQAALPFTDAELPTSGLAFVRRAAEQCQPAVPLADAPLPPLGDFAGDPALEAPLEEACGGETAGLALVAQLLAGGESAPIRRYADTRNGMDGGTGLSPFLALGCLSARHVAAAVAAHAAAHPGASLALGMAPGGLLFELAVRDFFRLSARRWGSRLFALEGPIPLSVPRAWSTDAALLAAWRAGRTGVPLVDAAMRQLLSTGMISNRARQVVASWAVLAAGLDWRCCAEHFEALLVDYDPSANAGNWLAIFGGSGGRENWFSVPRQAEQYDSDGAFVRRWLPELAGLPLEHLHSPWLVPQLLEGTGYPLVDVAALRTPPLSKKARAAAELESARRRTAV